jgi:hypothetical protein
MSDRKRAEISKKHSSGSGAVFTARAFDRIQKGSASSFTFFLCGALD